MVAQKQAQGSYIGYAVEIKLNRYREHGPMDDRAKNVMSPDNEIAEKRWRELLLPIQPSLFDSSARGGQGYRIKSDSVDFEEVDDLPGYQLKITDQPVS